jgi:hypothetical protein
MRRARVVLAAAVALIVMLSFSPAMSGETLLEKVQESGAEARGRVVKVVGNPVKALNTRAWTKYCLEDLCMRLPGEW